MIDSKLYYAGRNADRNAPFLSLPLLPLLFTVPRGGRVLGISYCIGGKK